MNETAIPLNAVGASGFERRPLKELTCFSPVLTGGCESSVYLICIVRGL
jgi:hypothetical protein